MTVRLRDRPQKLDAVVYYKKIHAADAPPSPAYVQQIMRALKRYGEG